MQDYRLWILFAAALLLRFYNISSESLWLDEGLSVRLASMTLSDINAVGLKTDHNPPLYLYLLHFWIKFFGSGEFALRSLSAILNTACVPLVWVIAKKLFNSRIAFISVFIFALSPFQIYYAQETRAYSLLCFTSLAATWAFLRLRANPAGKNYLLMTLSIILLLYSHIYGWFTLLYLNLWFILDRNNTEFSIRTWLTLQTTAVAAFTPYALILIDIVSNAQQGYWIKPPGLLHLVATPVYFSGSIWLFLLMITVLGQGAFYFLKREEKQRDFTRSFLFITVWLTIPILIPFLLSLILSPFFLPRYAIAASPAWYILIACGIYYFPNSQKLQSAGILALSLFMLSINFKHYNSTMREPWREAIQEIKTASEGAPVFVGSAFCIDEMFGYYWPECKTAIGLERKTLEEDINGGLKNLKFNGTVWFLSSHFEKKEKEALGYFSQKFNVAHYRNYLYRDLYGRRVQAIRLFKLTRNSADVPDN